jgi:hypothetical protein
MADGQSQTPIASKRSFKKWLKKPFSKFQSQSIRLPGSGQVNQEASSVQHVVVSSEVGASATTSQQGASDVPLSHR